jgi:hypothetical protein
LNRRVFLRCTLAWAGALSSAGAVAAAAAAAARVVWGSGARPAAGAKGASASALRTSRLCREGLEVARQHVLANCTHLDHPNAAIHGVRALGRELPLGSGDPYRILLESYLEETTVGGHVYLQVPVSREGHRHAMLKTLLEKGCEPGLRFRLGGKRYTFHDYIESSRLLTTYDLLELPIDEQSWTLIAMTRVRRPSRSTWKNALGQTIDLQRMIDDTSAALASDTEFVKNVDLAARPLSRDCPALGRVCGGLHMLYALAAAYAQGWMTPARRRTFADLLHTHVRRLTYDLEVTREVEAQNVTLAGQEAAQIVAFDTRLKFLGHTFEVVGVVDSHRLYEFTPDERHAIDAARDTLCELLASSRATSFARYKPDAELYDSLAGDVCHAYNGLVSSPA